MADGTVTLPVMSQSRQKVGEVEVPAAVVAGPVREHLLHAAVQSQLAGRRAGTAATKTKGFVSGGGKKPWRQKGTGRARAGSIRSPLWAGGGTIFGPQPRDYSYKMPKKAWRQALTLAISDRALNGKLVVVESLDLADAKTKQAQAALTALGLKHALIIFGDDDGNFFRAARNLAAYKLLPIAGLNVYDVLNYDELLMTTKTAKAIEERLGSVGK